MYVFSPTIEPVEFIAPSAPMIVRVAVVTDPASSSDTGTVLSSPTTARKLLDEATVPALTETAMLTFLRFMLVSEPARPTDNLKSTGFVPSMAPVTSFPLLSNQVIST